MSDAFDPYYKWLGIPVEDQPPHHYRLLGITLFESDPDVIEAAADRQMSHVQRYRTGQHSLLSQELLNELAAAKVCLLRPEKKAAYDQQLKASPSAKSPRSAPAPEPEPIAQVIPLDAPAPVQPLSAAPQFKIAPITKPAAPARPAVAKTSTRSRTPWFLAAGAAAACVVVVAILVSQRPATDDRNNPVSHHPITPTNVEPSAVSKVKLKRLPRQTVPEGQRLVVQVSPEGSAPPGSVRYTLMPPSPSAAEIDAATGKLTWEPGEEKGPQEHQLIVRLLNASTRMTIDETTIAVFVEEVNQPPVLEPVTLPPLDQSGMFSFTVHARDADLPPNNLSFSFDKAPAGSLLGNKGGEFTWTPRPEQLGKPFEIVLRVTDDGPGRLSATRTVRGTLPAASNAPAVASTKPQPSEAIKPPKPPEVAQPSKPSPPAEDPFATLAQTPVSPGDPRQDRLIAEILLKEKLGSVFVSVDKQPRYLSGAAALPDGDLQLLRVELSKGAFTDQSLSHFRGLKHLTSLDFFNQTGAGITDAGLEHLATIESLEVIGGARLAVSDDGYRHLCSLPRLREFRLTKGDISDAALAHLARVANLDTVFFGCENLTDEGFRHLAAAANLKVLRIGSPKVTGACLADLASLSHLEELELSMPAIPESSVAHLAGLRTLRSLKIRSDCPDSIFVQAAKLPNLQVLHLTCERLSGVNSASLEGCEQLVDLTIDSKDLRDEILLHLPKSLRSLHLASPRLTGAGLGRAAGANIHELRFAAGALAEENLAHLAKWPVLDRVYLFGTPPVSDVGLAHLAKIENLFTVMIGNAQGVTDAGLAEFKSRQKMRNLSLGKSQITDQGIAALKQAIPECKVQK